VLDQLSYSADKLLISQWCNEKVLLIVFFAAPSAYFRKGWDSTSATFWQWQRGQSLLYVMVVQKRRFFARWRKGANVNRGINEDVAYRTRFHHPKLWIVGSQRWQRPRERERERERTFSRFLTLLPPVPRTFCTMQVTEKRRTTTERSKNHGREKNVMCRRRCRALPITFIP